MSYSDQRTVQDYAFRHALLAAQRNDLPVFVHTGALAWGGADLNLANPRQLHNLLVDKRYQDVKVVVLHAGLPQHIGEATYLAGWFQNVYIDFTALTWVCANRFPQALTEWLEVVPDGKIMWGSDSNPPETVVGIDSVSRQAVADVLEDCVSRKIIDETEALRFIEDIYLNTPRQIFGL